MYFVGTGGNIGLGCEYDFLFRCAMATASFDFLIFRRLPMILLDIFGAAKRICFSFWELHSRVFWRFFVAFSRCIRCRMLEADVLLFWYVREAKRGVADVLNVVA
jgi:hypothetical protein